jgi:predicted dehydrogenase
MTTLRTGILGCGDFANRHAQIALDLLDELSLVAFCDRNETKATAFEQKYAPGAAVFTDHRQMLDQAKLDLLIVALPPYGHSVEVQLAAQRGIHILMEKPIALTSEHAWQMVEVVEKAAIKTQVGFMFRFGEAIDHFKTLQAAGQTGPIALMSARYFCNSLHAPWWRMRDKSGGQVVEQIIHMFDLMRYLMGDPVSIYSRQSNLFHQDVPDYTVEDTSATIINFPRGEMGVIYATNNAIPGKWINDYRVVTHRFTIDFTNANNATFTETDKPELPITKIESTKDFRRNQTLDLISAIRTGGETRTPMREGAKSLDVVLAARRSAETRAEVAL